MRTMWLIIRGKRWRLRRGRPMRGKVGHCDEAAREIVLSPKLAGWALVGTTIHEVTHACFPDLSEEAVVEHERAVTEALHKIWTRPTCQREPEP